MKKIYFIAIGGFLLVLLLIATIVTKLEIQKEARKKPDIINPEQVEEYSEDIEDEDILIESTGVSDYEEVATTGNADKELGATERVTYSDNGTTIYINNVGGERYDFSDAGIYPDLINYECEIQNADKIPDDELPIERFVAQFYMFCIQREFTLPSAIKIEERELNEDVEDAPYVIYYMSFDTTSISDELNEPLNGKMMVILEDGKIEICNLTDDQ